MCLAVPMKVVEIDEHGRGIADLDGVRHAIDLSLLENPAIGSYVIVHAGFAIQALDEKEANARLRLFEELAVLKRQEETRQ